MTSPRLNTSQLRHALKTALAAVASYLLTSLFQLPQGYWAVVSVTIVMQANLGGSLKAGWMRIVGTAVGACMGVASLLVFGHGVTSLGFSLGLTILICSYFTYLHESFRLAGLTACIIIFSGNQEVSPLVFGLHRFLEITLGVAVALAVSMFVWPSRAGAHLTKGVSRVLYDEAEFYSLLLSCRVAECCSPGEERLAKAALEKTRAKNLALLAEAKQEPSGFSRSEHITVSLFNFSERIAEHLLAMEHAIHGVELEPLHQEVAGSMDSLAQTTITAMTALAMAIDHNRPPGPMDGLKTTIALAEKALGQVRKKRTLASHELESVMRFFSYYYNMREIAVELLGMVERAQMLEG